MFIAVDICKEPKEFHFEIRSSLTLKNQYITRTMEGNIFHLTCLDEV
jgi:hypothetical protein